MIEIVTDEKLAEHGVNMFGEVVIKTTASTLCRFTPHQGWILLEDGKGNILHFPDRRKELCGPMGRVMP